MIWKRAVTVRDPAGAVQTAIHGSSRVPPNTLFAARADAGGYNPEKRHSAEHQATMVRPPDNPPPAPPADDRLDSWKEITAYLQRDVTTVQRWEKREEMPVHRHLHNKIGSVYAYRGELDAWVQGRSLRGDLSGATAEASSSPTPQTSRSPACGPCHGRGYGLILIAAGAIAAGGRFWLQRDRDVLEQPGRRRGTSNRSPTSTVWKQPAPFPPTGVLPRFSRIVTGRTDVWVTRIGSAEFHNLTHGVAPELANPLVRALGIHARRLLGDVLGSQAGGQRRRRHRYLVRSGPGGPSTPYLNGAGELDWSRDGSRLVYHTTGPGDPMFVTTDTRHLPGTSLFTAPAGFHAHFPLWSPDATFIYFVQGALPDKLDIWRLQAWWRTRGTASRRTTAA